MRTALAFAVLGLASTALAQQIPIPAFGSTFTSTLTRGFWFQAPANFLIVGLKAPNESAQPFQTLEVIDLGTTPPPAYPGTVVGTQLFYTNSDVGTSIVSTAIPCVAGNYYGILGASIPSIGSSTSNNSYSGITGAYASNILGLPTTLTRFGTQFGIGAGGNQPCWSEVGGTFCRVEVYVAPSGSGTIATNTTLGAGCISIPDVSSYENFASSASFDLANTAISFLNTGGGYIAIPGVTTYVPPSATAQVLVLGDDTETSVTLSQAMPVGASSSTNTLVVCSNGYVSAGLGNGTGFTPDPNTFLNGTQAWWSLAWHDLNPSIVGSGQVKFEQIGNIAYVTWDGVWDYGGASAANANTFQAQFDVTTGTVHYVYQTMSTAGNGMLTGFSDAGPSADPGSMDISAALPGTYTAATFLVQPLAVAASSRPVTGTNWNLNTTQVPQGSAIGVDIFGLSDPNVPDLFFLGMPGCGLRSSLDVLNAWLPLGGTHAYSLTIPADPALVNLHVYTSSAVFKPGINAFGAITSNGIDGKIGDL